MNTGGILEFLFGSVCFIAVWIFAANSLKNSGKLRGKLRDRLKIHEISHSPRPFACERFTFILL